MRPSFAPSWSQSKKGTYPSLNSKHQQNVQKEITK